MEQSQQLQELEEKLPSELTLVESEIDKCGCNALSTETLYWIHFSEYYHVGLTLSERILSEFEKCYGISSFDHKYFQQRRNNNKSHVNSSGIIIQTVIEEETTRNLFLS